MGLPVLRRMHAASDVGVAESSIKSLVSLLLADTCRGGRGEADFISYRVSKKHLSAQPIIQLTQMMWSRFSTMLV